MKFKEIKGLAKIELEAKHAELCTELIKDYAQVATGTIPKSPGKINNTKKTLARIKTILRLVEAE
ncbi:MAG: 50S ribosomal protein L29 [Nanoarchaeota archaeon]